MAKSRTQFNWEDEVDRMPLDLIAMKLSRDPNKDLFPLVACRMAKKKIEEEWGVFMTSYDRPPDVRRKLIDLEFEVNRHIWILSKGLGH